MKFSRQEFLDKLGISGKELEEWINKKLIADIKKPLEFFSEAAYRQAKVVKRFLSMGYSIIDILKIKNDIGLPKNEKNQKSFSKSDYLTIGDLAELTNVNTRTIKFWEEKNLITPYKRSDGGFRLYRIRDAEIIKFIKDLQTLNCTLSEIGNILQLLGTELGQREIDLEEMKLEELEKLYAGLEYLIDRMKEIRKATFRVESIFNVRLKLVAKILKQKRKVNWPIEQD